VSARKERATAPRKKRTRLTHIVIHRGEALQLRVAIADEALADCGDELGTLIKKIAPSTQTSIIQPIPEPDPIFAPHDTHDIDFHANTKEHLVAFFGALCDTSLADALEIAREERARRSEGGN
jgi:hypothetical protein